MSPNDAKKLQNEMTVKFNLELKAKKNRKYPALNKDSEVRIMMKKETGKTKGYMPKWSKQVYKVIHVNNKDYMVNDGKRKVYQRHEILKV